MTLDNWIRLQYGQGRLYPSARALSMAVSGGHNPNAVADMHARGVARLETLLDLARVCHTDPVFLMGLAVGLDTETIGARVESDEEVRLLRAFRRLDQMARRLVLQGCEGAAYGSEENPETSLDTVGVPPGRRSPG